MGHSIESFAGFGVAVAETTAGFMLLSGASEENTEKLEKAIGTVMAFEGVAEGVIHAQKIWNTTIKNSTVLTSINSTATKIAGATQKLFTGSINTTTVAFKGLKTAIIATGIGALVVAIGLLIANFDKLKGAINGVSKEQKDALDDQEKAVDLAKERLDLISEQENILKLQGKSEREILDLKLEASKVAIATQIKLLESTIKLEKAQIDAEKRNKKYLENFTKVIFIIPRTILKGIDLIGEGLNRVFQEVQKIPFAKKILGEEPINIDFGLGKMADGGIESVAGLIFNPVETTEKATETINETTKALNKLRNELAGFELSKKDMDQNTADELKKRQDEEKEKWGKLQKAKIITKEEVDLELVEKEQTLNERLLELYGEDVANYKRKQKEKKALARAVEQAKLQSAVDGIGALMNLTNAFAKNNEKSQRRAFEINKKLQIAQAVISTYQSATGAYATASLNPISVYFPAYPSIMAGIAVATGLANVAQISKQQFQSSSTGGGAQAMPNFGGGGSVSAPNLAPTNQSTLIPQDEEVNATQVFVTETDITNTQNKVNVIETQATF